MKRSIWLMLFISTFVFTKAQTITMDTFSSPPGYWCGGDSFYVYFTATGSFNSPNYFAVQLSDASGDFSDGVTISDSVPGSADSIQAGIPLNVSSSSAYLVRVVSTNPVLASNDNGSGLTIFVYPQTPALSSNSTCLGTAILNTNTANNTRVIWYVNGTDVYSSLTGSYAPIYAGNFTAKTQSGSCLSKVSDTITIYDTARAAVSISSSAIACYGTPDTFSASASNGGNNPSYQWYWNGVAVGTNASTYVADSIHNNDTIAVVFTSNAVCVTGSPATGQLLASVFPSPPTPVISVSGHGCLGADSLTIVAGGPFEVTWYQNGIAIDSSIKAYTVAGGNGSGSAADQLLFPYSVFVDGAGNIYVADDFNSRIQKFPPGSTSTTNGVTIAANGLGAPTGVCVDDSGNIYVADPGNGVVWKFPAGGDSSTVGAIVAGDPNPGANESAANGLNAPVAIYLDSSGNLYVADDGNDRIQKFPPGSDSLTNAVTVAKKQISSVDGVYLDRGGNVYVSDYDSGFIWKFPAGGDSTTVGTIVAAHQLLGPGDLYVDGSNNIYVADQGNNRIQKFPAGSDSSTVGITVAGGLVAGNSPTQLNTPSDVFLDSSGNIYVADVGNNRIQKWIPGAPDTMYAPITPGTYAATYVPPTGGCPSLLSDSVVIHQPPAVSLSWDSLVQEGFLALTGVNPVDTYWCPSLPFIIPLSGGNPSGGVYSGDNVMNDSINFTNLNNIHFYSQDTVFYTFTDANGCTAQATDSFDLIICEGINNIAEQNSIFLYPDPNTGSFMLESSDDVLGKEFIVSDMLGRILAQQVITTNKQIVTLENISPGIYALKIEGGNVKAILFTVTR